MTRNDLLQKAEEYMKTKYRFELTEDEAEGGYVICQKRRGCKT